MPFRPLEALEAARGHLFPMIPVLMAVGIAIWFALPAEPGAGVYAACAAGLAALGLLARQGRWQPVAIGAAAVLAGVLLIGLRAWMQEAPILGFRYYGAVEGRVIGIDRSATDRLRLTLDHVVLERTAPDRTPAQLRVSLHGDQPLRIEPGQTVILTAHLSPPMPPSEPGGFDFRRMAWFERLGAIGYARTPVLLLEPPPPTARPIDRLRAVLSGAVQAHVPGQAGAFASGAVTGDRSAITQDTVEALRDSNLSHLLAISGMNVAFLTGFTFALLRYGLALWPWLALRVDTRRVAAVVSMGVAGFYFALSGGNLATERAFIMAVIMLGAILAGRRAVSMRTIALAGIIMLALQPEALMNVGFQMSMAATIALVAGFAAVDRLTFRQRLPRWALPVYTAVLSSVIGGLATGPIAAAQFNRFAEFGLLANLLTVPAMGTLIMPGAVVATLLGPIGLPQPGMWMMELGARWILGVAHWIAAWKGASLGIVAPPAWVMPGMSLGAAWLIVWPGRARLAGVVAIAAGLLAWPLAERPAVLISDDGAAVGVMTPLGRAMSYPTGAGFAVGSWLERDGDLATQADAALREGFRDQDGIRIAEGPLPVAHLKGKGSAARVAEACALAPIVVLAGDSAEHPEGCLVLDHAALRDTGAVALSGRPGAIRMDRALGGARWWDGDQ
ncbi:ComEC/Rec2 family competence protein [Falsirhodobacter algicola]|uniref:DUF4131 domain-containing protein n=1 Tax=Falsirhodobacter algicola TaxID=2692330 RepID=A0A8J8MSM0_9RHOB|nr:ComEC/Rec2 family competence protein [Falsirhodobacter algicola]QUS35722.1 DUF4131 domain-containing protein [Falsirhodobacter algicola]